MAATRGVSDICGVAVARWEPGRTSEFVGRRNGGSAEVNDTAVAGVPVDLAEPAFALGFGDAGDEVVADLDQAEPLGGVWPEQGAAHTGLSEPAEKALNTRGKREAHGGSRRESCLRP